MKYIEARSLARQLRKDQTLAEKKFWEKCRNRRLLNLKFYRQYLVKYKFDDAISKYFIVDFYCHSLKLIIEVDGKIHKYRKQYDQERSDIISCQGYSILRFTNGQVLNQWDYVKNKIRVVVIASNSTLP